MFPRYLIQEPIEKGWSCDRKYRVAGQDGASYLLRVTPPEKSASREALFSVLRQVAALDIPMCRPVAAESRADGFYLLQTWIDGEDLQQVLPGLSRRVQYDLGAEAGAILRKIHTVPAPPDQPDWESRFNRKIDRKIRLYRDCGLTIPGGEAFTGYLAAHRHLLAGRPQCFQHGDYHTGNMMLGQGRLFIIDFDRYDFGDPWEEFNRIVWCAQLAPPFACGMIDGYFSGAVPPGFWPLLALYISSNTLGSVAWAIPFGREQIGVMTGQAGDVLRWYDGMSRTVPGWYCPENLAGTFPG